MPMDTLKDYWIALIETILGHYFGQSMGKEGGCLVFSNS